MSVKVLVFCSTVIHSKARSGSYIQRKSCLQIALFLLLQKLEKKKKDVFKLQSEFIYSEKKEAFWKDF